MSSRLTERLRATFGLHLAAWYAGVFVLGALGIFGLSYVLLARSLEQRDREVVRMRLTTYASEYETSGPAGLWRTLAAEEALGAHVDLFVRAIDSSGATALLSLPGRWAAFDLGRPVAVPPPGTYAWERIRAARGDDVLELATLPLPDGALLQVGRSTQERREVLKRFRGQLLMDISEAEAGVMALHLETVPVADLFAEAEDLLGDVAEEKHVTLRVEDAGPLAVRADRTRARQALTNLVDNAVKFTPPGGEVTLSARREGTAVALSVTDTGIGIPSEDLPHVWERLFRGDRSRSERGLGLGLSLVRAIALAHGGEAAVESVPGEGSRFTLRLPAAAP
jgi:signal transduction histidine kinase